MNPPTSNPDFAPADAVAFARGGGVQGAGGGAAGNDGFVGPGPLSLARPLALGLGVVLVAVSGLAWGVAGALSAAIGVLISVANVWVLARLEVRARVEAACAAAGDAAAVAGHAASRLQVALGAKTIILLALVALVAQTAPPGLSMTAFALGLLVSVFALVAGGLIARPA